MASIIAVGDLPVSIQTHELVSTLVDGANAKASRVAPCLGWDGTVTDQPASSEDQLAEARLVLIGAIKRWTEIGSGALQSQTAGPFGMQVDTRQRTGFNLWPSEITALQDICASGKPSGAFSIDTAPGGTAHMPWCSINLGATYCSCGADLTAEEYPLYEGGVLTGDDY